MARAMIALLMYLGITGTAAIALAFVVALVRGTGGDAGLNPLRGAFGCLFLTVAGPFLYVEGVTKLHAQALESAVREGYAAGSINGPLQYFKVTEYANDHAKVLAVGEEKENWGGTDRPIMEMKLHRGSEGWKVDSFQTVYSDRLGRDGVVFPPYR